MKLLLLPNDSTVEASLVSGEPLPEGIRFNATNKTFFIEQLSKVNLPIEVKLTLKNQSKVLAEKVILVTEVKRKKENISIPLLQEKGKYLQSQLKGYIFEYQGLSMDDM